MIKLRQLLSEIYIDGFASTDERQGFHRPENFDDYAEGKGWTAYRGGNDWENGVTACAVYFGNGEEHARIWFTVKVPKGMSQDSDCPKEQQKEWQEWGEKASKKWLSEARKIHSKPKEYFKDGSPWYKEWKTCFIEALKSKEMKKYVKDWGVDSTHWKKMKKSEPEKAEKDKLPVGEPDSPEPKQAVNEGSSIPGALEGWLDPEGKCFYVEDTHADWIARKFNLAPPDTSDAGAWESQNIRLKKMLYDKKWARIIIQHGDNLLYFESDDLPWQQFTNAQKRWLKDAALHGVKIQGDEIVIADATELRPTPYRLQFGGGKGGNVDVDLQERNP